MFVHFSEQPPIEHECNCEQQQPEDIWYPMDYLQAVRREEIKNNLRAQYFSKKDDNSSSKKTCPVSSIESDTLTWRGLEDILGNDCCNRKDKNARHVRAILAKQETLQTSSSKPQQTLRTFARSLSKADRRKALQLAAQDAKAVGVEPTTRRPFKERITSSFRRSWSPASSTKSSKKNHKKAANSMDLFQWKFHPSGSRSSSNDSLQSSRTMTSELEQEPHPILE